MYREDRQHGRQPNQAGNAAVTDEAIILQRDVPAEAPERPAESKPEPAKPVGEPESEKASKLARLKKSALALLVLAALGGAVWYGNYWLTTGRYLVATDDAYVGAHNTTLAAKVSGYVSAIPIEDNQHVKAGDLIARIDDGDYRLALESARDKAATQQATVTRIDRQIAASQSAVDQAKAQQTSAEANAVKSQLEFDRQQELSQKQFGSRQAFEQARAARDQANASVENAKAAVTAAETQVEVVKAQKDEAERVLKELQTAQAKAERDLSFTELRAPVDAVIGNRAVHVGDYVQPGQRLATLIPLSGVYVDANFKETQLRWIKLGQKVDVAVDAYPDRDITGTVESFAPASGSVFSLLPPENATGNFTKIVQRVPVRVAVPPKVAGQGILRPGMSVVVSVSTKAGDDGQPINAAEKRSAGN